MVTEYNSANIILLNIYKYLSAYFQKDKSHRLVGLSNICYTLLNKFSQDSLW
jgi:hypothetical protein